MPSIHPDYEYDIFISYRQNDNRSDKWVTNFVNALKEELIATLKNPVSIYFDENPHDGLLETHQVDASLAKKLKCLIFIPIISQTYCDESSFAWEHEFLPFINMAKEDELGMNITLSNGNVVSRVLPVKIHDLDTEDQYILEGVLDGALRSIDFIYNEPGVNRPLKPNDDRNLNLEKTDYQNQINKVANSLKDIGLSIINQADGEISVPTTKPEILSETKSSNRGKYIGLATILIALLSYWGYKQFYNAPVVEAEDVTIAVLAFDDQSPNGDQEWLGDGMADEILNVLAKVEGLQVTGKTSSFSFKGKGRTTKEIGETLNVSTVLEGSVSKIGDKLRITAQLIDVETDAHLWSKKYDRDADDIFNIMDEVAQNIAKALKNELSIKELENIKVGYEVNPEAYEYFLKGVNLHWYSKRRIEDYEQSEQMFKNSIKIDSTYIEAYAGFADLYDSWYEQYGGNSNYKHKRDSLIQIMLDLDPNSPYSLLLKSFKFKGPPHTNLDSLFHYLHRAYILDPENFNNRGIIMSMNYRVGLYNQSRDMCYSLLRIDPLNNLTRGWLVASLIHTGAIDEANSNLNKTLQFEIKDDLANKNLFYLNVLYDKDLIKAKNVYQRLEEVNPGNNKYQLALLLALEGKREEALNTSKSMGLYSILEMKKEALIRLDSLGTKQNYIWGYCYLNLVNDIEYDFIRDEPQFKEILAKAKKVHEERVAKYAHYFDEE